MLPLVLLLLLLSMVRFSEATRCNCSSDRGSTPKNDDVGGQFVCLWFVSKTQNSFLRIATTGHPFLSIAGTGSIGDLTRSAFCVVFDVTVAFFRLRGYFFFNQGKGATVISSFIIIFIVFIDIMVTTTTTTVVIVNTWFPSQVTRFSVRTDGISSPTIGFRFLAALVLNVTLL